VSLSDSFNKTGKYAFSQFNVAVLYCFMLRESQFSYLKNVILEVWVGVLD
jgi:hypothetical protein